MSFSQRIHKAFQLLLIFSSATLGSSFILSKTEFFSPAQASAAATLPLPTAQTPVLSYADAVALAAPAVVSIRTTKEIPSELNPFMQDPAFRYFFGEPGGNIDPNQKELQQGLGSGVIVDAKGYILTNNHVIKDANSVIVSLPDGREGEAKVVGSDPDTDLAVLQVKLDKLPIIPMGSSGELRVGDVVLAIGNPFNIGQTVTQGIISATERSETGINLLENFIQTDAALNLGNSGGALIDAKGKLIGINTAIYTRSGGYQGIGFAIPIDQAKLIMAQLMDGGKIIRGWLGVQLQPLTKEIRDYINYKDKEGVYVRALVRGSPAQKAGLLPGDVITKIDGKNIKDVRQALRVVADLKPHKSYTLDIFRKGEDISFTVVLEERKLQPVKHQ